MSTIPTVTAIADSLGITLTDRITRIVATENDRMVTSFLELANRIRRHRGSLRLTISDLKHSLDSRGISPLVGYHSSYKIYEYSAIPQSPIHGLCERDIPLTSTARLLCPQYPFDLTFHFHWLAIAGIQPRIPENLAELPPELFSGQELVGPPPPLEPPNQPVSVICSDSGISKPLADFFADGIRAPDLTPHLADLSISPAIQPLIPHYLRYVTGLLAHPRAADLQRCLDISRAIFANPNVDCEPFLHTFETIALTLILEPRFPKPADSDWALREAGADFLAVIVAKFAGQYPAMREKIAEKLVMAMFGEGIAMTSQYGAAFACYALGPEIAKEVVLPNLAGILGGLRNAMESEDGELRLQATRLKSVLQRICMNLLAGEAAGAVVRGMDRWVDRETAEVYDVLIEFFGFMPFTGCTIPRSGTVAVKTG